MKKRLLFSFFISVMFCFGAEAQLHGTWTVFPISNINGSINKIDFPAAFSANRGYQYGMVVGENEDLTGFVGRTSDGGTRWTLTTTAIPNIGDPVSSPKVSFKGLTGFEVARQYMYVWGKEGTLMRSNTSGGQWFKATLPQGARDCIDAAFLSDGTIGVITDGENIFFTQDAAVNWMQCVIPAGVTGINEIIYIKDNCLIAVAANNTVLASSTSGYSWNKIEHATDGTADYSSIVIKSGNTTNTFDVIIGGIDDYQKPVIFKATMIIDENSVITSFKDMFKTSTLDSNGGVKGFIPSVNSAIYTLTTDGKIYKSIDDGLNWGKEDISSDGKEIKSMAITNYDVKYLVGAAGLFAFNSPTPSASITAIKRADDTYYFTADYKGYLTGFSWEFEKGNPPMSSFAMPGLDVVFYETGEQAVSVRGIGKLPGAVKNDTIIAAIKVTTVKQGDWDLIKSDPKNSYLNSDIFFPEGQNLIGYMVSQTSTAGDKGHIWKTEDGGNTWRCVLQSSTDPEITVKGLRNVWFTSMDVGYACGWAVVKWNDNWTAVMGRYPQIWKTVDAGENWRLIDVGKYSTEFKQDFFSSITFIDENNGVVHNQTDVFYTIDAGETWEKATVGNKVWNNITAELSFLHMCYVDEKTLFGVGKDEQIYKSEDGGKTWNIKQTAEQGSQKTFMYVAFRDKNHGYVLTDDTYEGRFLETTDGGENWSVVDPGVSMLYDGMTFVNDSVYYAGGSPGEIIKTIDSGKTWTLEKHASLGETPKAFMSSATGVIFVAGSSSTFKRLIPEMKAGFSYTMDEELVVSLESTSVGFITSFKWEINGELRSTLMNPSVNLVDGQINTIKLTVSGIDPRDNNLVEKTIEKTIDLTGSSVPNIKLIEYLGTYPNPVVDNLNIKINLNSVSDINIVVRSLTGQEIESRRYDKMNAGEAVITLDAKKWHEGVYFVTLGTERATETVKVIRK